MKKSIIALAALGALSVSTSASAQSSVTMYGIIDAHVNFNNNQTATGGKKSSLDSSGIIPSRWGIKGEETLDGGLKANFKLESSLNVDTGTGGSAGLFDRNATIGLSSSSFGSLDIGRQEVVARLTLIPVDPTESALGSSYNPNVAFGANANSMYSTHGNTTTGGAIRQNNTIKYVTPTMVGGLNLMAIYGFGEKAGDASANSYSGVNAAYSANGVLATFGYSQARDATNSSTLRSYAGGVKVKVSNDFNLKASYASNELNTTKRDISVFSIGGDYAVSPQVSLMGGYYATRRSGDFKGKADMFVGVMKYSFSKRTLAYTSLAYVKAGTKNAADTDLGLFVAAGNRNATRGSVGLVHYF